MSKKKSAAEPVEYIDSQAFDAAKEKIIGKSHNDKGDRYFVGKDTACSIKNVL